MKNELGIPVNYIKEKIAAMEARGNQPDADTLQQIVSDDSKIPPSLKERRKSEIINAGVKIFSDKGFYKTKVKDITDAHEMSTGTFYIYFNNKEDLFLEAIDDVVKSIVGGAAQAIVNALIKEFSDAIDQGLIRPIDPDLTSYAVTGLIETLSFRMTLDDTYTTDKVIEYLIDFFMQGVPVTLSEEQTVRVMAFLEEIRS